MSIVPKHIFEDKHCFVYCGDERCDCLANHKNRISHSLQTIKQNTEYWLVIDAQGYPVHCASYKDACNEHINDAINEFDLDEAKQWRVVQVVIKD